MRCCAGFIIWKLRELVRTGFFLINKRSFTEMGECGVQDLQHLPMSIPSSTTFPNGRIAFVCGISVPPKNKFQSLLASISAS
jgi:hypothetical protein